MAKKFTRAELLVMIADLVDTCAPITLKVTRDHVLILECPPRLINTMVQHHGYDGWHMSMRGGGLRIEVADTDS